MRQAVIKDVKKQRLASIKTVKTFRVKFINIGIESSTPGLPSPIGIAVIGFNNYIL